MSLRGCRAVSVLRDFLPLNSPLAHAGQKESQVLGDEKLESTWASQGSGPALLQLHPSGVGYQTCGMLQHGSGEPQPAPPAAAPRSPLLQLPSSGAGAPRALRHYLIRRP